LPIGDFIQLANNRGLIEIQRDPALCLGGHTMTAVLLHGSATGVVINGAVHVLKRSSSRYHLSFDGRRGQYCCQDGCCDRGLRPDVTQIVEEAKALGVTKVVIRTGQREFYQRTIAGLPVEDVTSHVGRLSENAQVFSAW
jgi:hypothetical protein